MSEKKKEPKAAEGSKTLRISLSVDTILVRSPLRFLSDAIKGKRFLEGVVVSVMYFERFGVDRLKEYFKSKDIPLEPMEIEDLRLKTILRMLEGFGIIDQPTHSSMGEVRRERNDIVHKLRHPDAIDEGKARKTIEKAMECLKALGAT